VQAVVLAYPMGVNRLVEMLADRREVIRNEMLLMLEALTLGNENIKKIVAFEGYSMAAGFSKVGEWNVEWADFMRGWIYEFHVWVDSLNQFGERAFMHFYSRSNEQSLSQFETHLHSFFLLNSHT
jgi:hypothetical protein